jgi:hypothetical protein
MSNLRKAVATMNTASAADTWGALVSASAASSLDEKGALIVGRSIRWPFDDVGTTDGKIVSVDRADGPPLYCVRFEDGDEHFFEEEELQPLLRGPKPGAGQQWQTKPCGGLQAPQGAPKTKRKQHTTRSRNSYVDSMLQTEEDGEDTYADLEEWIVFKRGRSY